MYSQYFRDDALFAIDRMALNMTEFGAKLRDEHNVKNTPIFSGLEAAIENVRRFGRKGSRIILGKTYSMHSLSMYIFHDFIGVLTNGLTVDMEPTVDRSFDFKRFETSRRVMNELNLLDVTVLVMAHPLVTIPTLEIRESARRFSFLLASPYANRESAVRFFTGKRQMPSFLNEFNQKLHCKRKRVGSSTNNFTNALPPRIFVRSTADIDGSQKTENTQLDEIVVDNEVNLVEVVAALAEDGNIAIAHAQ
jgi:hypothetical protein